MALFSCCLFQTSPYPSSWNKVIKKQVLEENHERAILTFNHMQATGVSADSFTYPVLLKAIGALSLRDTGFALHGHIIKTGFSGHAFVQTALLGMYSSFRCIGHACKAFEQMTVKDVVAWNSMLSAYVSHGEIDDAAILFDLMPSKDLLSYNIMISGYASIGSVACARNVFDESPVRDVVSRNSMILACGNAGDMREARKLFDEMPERSVITWNTMLVAYLNNELPEDAVALFEKMKFSDVKPDYLTLTHILSACAQLGSLDKGRELHAYAQECGLALSPHVVTALIDMYAKCGNIRSSLQVFYKSQVKDIFSWNAVISGMALHGNGLAALKAFDDMRGNKMQPDDITFVVLLSACSHAGLLQEGCQLFNSMQRDFRITPKLEHYGCMVDLLGRAGYLDDSFRIIESMPFEPGKTILGALLGACLVHRNLETGGKVVKVLSNMEGDLSDGEYMMVANLYASCNRWEEASKWREMMNDTGVAKSAGRSVIEIQGRACKFLAGDNSKMDIYFNHL